MKYTMSKRKPTSSQPGICKSRRTESLVDKGEKTAGDGDQQTSAIPMCKTSNSATRVDGLFIYLFIYFICYEWP